MTGIFEHNDYVSFLKHRLHLMPKQGHGQLRKIAAYLRIHPTRMSQIFTGKVDFTPEQAALLSAYLNLNENESEFFLTLVDLARAGNEELRRNLRRRLAKLKESTRDLATSLPRDKTLKNEHKAVFYSSWKYSAVRLASGISGTNSIEALSRRLQLSPSEIMPVVEFLLSVGLCVNEDGKIRMGPASTHLESHSPFISRHHSNWRLRAMNRHDVMSRRELAYTGPMVIDENAQETIRQLLVEMIQKITRTAIDAHSEKLMCLNIDWLEM